MERLYRLIGVDGKGFESTIPGELGGSRPKKIYGRLDCNTALRAIANGGYIKNRVFFLNQETAISAGYRPCARCMKLEYALWKQQRVPSKTIAM